MKIKNALYVQDIEHATNASLPWEDMLCKHILITGATGLIGVFLVDCLVYLNEIRNLNITITAMARNAETANACFGHYLSSKTIAFIAHDINNPIPTNYKYDYVIHAASNTHPNAYATDPVGTITANVLGTYNLLECIKNIPKSRLLFISSVEVYGENRGDVEFFNEDYCGYINCNTLRAGYPEAKRVAEAMCQAYIAQYGVNVVIARLSRTYGATMRLTDSKALSQFILNAVNERDIILKSEGTQKFSYCYVADAVKGLLHIMLLGKNGEVYNAANDSENILLRDIAQIAATQNGKDVIFQLPDQTEAKGFSTATTALLNCNKLRKLGWNPHYSMESGIERTVKMLKDNLR